MQGGQLLLEGNARPVPPDDRSAIRIPVSDPACRSLLLSRFLAALDDSRQVPSFARSGLTVDLVDQLRQMTATDAVRLAEMDCGITISVDGDTLRQRLAGMQRDRTDREILEHFLRAGASPKLISRLWRMADSEVRQVRRLVEPKWALGGRPPVPDDSGRIAIKKAWDELRRDSALSERERYFQLSQRFPEFPMVSLERVVGSSLI
jgi:hypothetical protein